MMKTTSSKTVILMVAMAGMFWSMGALADGLKIGDPMPMKDYEMKNVDGTMLTTAGVVGKKATVVAFWCNHCPFVVKYRERFITLAKTFGGENVGFIAVNSNDPAKVPGDSLEAMQAIAKQFEYPFPFTVDAGAKLATAYGATRTPHIFVFDADHKLVYVGAIDDNPDPAKAVKPYLKQTLEALLAGKDVPLAETKAFGCTIKWPK